MNLRHVVRCLPLLLACLLLTLGGCGKKGPVKPLEKPLPSAPKKLTAIQQGSRFQVAWDIPTVNQDGSPLTDLQGFKVFKMRYELANDCPECRDTSTLLQQVDLEFPKYAERRGNRLTIWDNELEAGYGYQYRVVAYTQRDREGEAVVVRRPFLPILPAPEGVAVSPHDRMARITWQPVAAVTNGELLGYNLYRRSPGEEPTSLPINTTPVTDTVFEDFGLQNGVTYGYGVRAIVQMGAAIVESAASAPVEISPQGGQ